MSYYYRKPNKENYKDDIRNLNNKIDIVYTSLENIIEKEMIYYNCLIPE